MSNNCILTINLDTYEFPCIMINLDCFIASLRKRRNNNLSLTPNFVRDKKVTVYIFFVLQFHVLGEDSSKLQTR